MSKAGVGILFWLIPLLGLSQLIEQEESGIGIVSQFQRMSLDRSLSYTYHQFDPDVFRDAAHEHFNINPFEAATEQYSRYALVGTYLPSQQLGLQIELPFHFNRRDSGDDFFATSKSGIGDLKLSGSYVWWSNYSGSGESDLRMHLQGGVSFPTGAFDRFDDSGELEPQFEPGSGALNFLGGHIVEYLPDYGRLRLITQINFNQKNRYGYKYGNQFTGALDFSKKWGASDFWIGLFKVSYQNRWADEMNGRTLFFPDEGGEDTGGQWLDLGIQVQKKFSNWMLGATLNYPLWQDLDGQQFTRNELLGMHLFRFLDPTINAK